MSEPTNRTPPYTVTTAASQTAVVCDVTGRRVFTIDREYMLGRTIEEAVAVAEDIVRRVNMHDKLVAACKDLDSIKGKIPEFPGSVFLEAARDLARAALADAQGGDVPLLTPRCSDPTCKRCNPTDEQICDCGLIADAQGGVA